MITHTNKYTKEVENALKAKSANADLNKSIKLKKYIGTNLLVYGLTSSQQVEVNKLGFSFCEESQEKTFLEFDRIYKTSTSFEGKNQAFIFLDRNYKTLPLNLLIKFLPDWVNEVDNWAHSDNLSKFLSRLVESPITQKAMLKFILQWNVSANLWQRRQSLVALFYYSRTQKQHLNFNFTINLVQNLVHDDSYFVQKAVGWTLREIFNVYPKETFKYLTENINSISGSAFTAATEKLTASQKILLKTKRKYPFKTKLLSLTGAAVIFVFTFASLGSYSQKIVSPEDYITKYKDDAIKEMYLHKVPACITLAQGMLESGNGNSKLSVNANNHFGIKCHKEWSGETYFMDDDESNECFRKYESVFDSYSDHSLFLYSRSRYASLFELPVNDYKAWCYGLKAAGYATDPRYSERLIELIERYKLQELNTIENTPKQNFPAHDEIKTEMVLRQVYRFNHVKFIISKNNDSYYKIAHDFNIELDELLEFNDLTKKDKLQFGQKIYIEKKRRKALEPYHVVQKNESLKSISQLHGIRMSMLCKKNRLKPDTKLKIGDVLYLRQRKSKT